MLVFGFGITTDVEHIRFASLDLDQTPDSDSYLESFASIPRYFTREPPLSDTADMQRRMKANEISLAIEVPPGFGRDFARNSGPEVSAWVDGANPFRAETIKQYATGVHTTYLKDRYRSESSKHAVGLPAGNVEIQSRFMYNPTFESIYAIVPSVPPILLVLIPAVLMAVSVVREKELGSITNFYVTPTSRLEFLLGKQLPYIVIGLVNFGILLAMAVVIFGVPVKGSGLALLLCAASTLR